MKPVCVLGNGQLGRMLRQAGESLGIKVYPIGLDAKLETIPYQESIITTEIECWPETILTRKLAKQETFINRDIFSCLADRMKQKELLDNLGLPTAPWLFLENTEQYKKIFTIFNQFVIVKRRTGGYDGHGQWRLNQGEQYHLPLDIYGKSIIEQGINFSAEVSLIGARSNKERLVFYPLTSNLHKEGILRISVTIPQLSKKLQQKAETMLSMIMKKLNYIGVMTMECFIDGNNLLVNELAPRVHNSGHWTQNGASISQFELHLRAILNLPLPKPVVNSPSVMINLIGTPINYAWLSLPLIHLHWYEKEARVGRKLGHLNMTDLNTKRLSSALIKLAPLLPNEYQHSINWAIQKLSSILGS
ncbi:5-(carboxyamino)imidazole ribonucleotide synthase [Candidatus Fukatsuia anoeciicola]|uniref:5-(carboxyamino)imidazole ribonucleotide synthase n=1 Tax=Candidatus Fukatsuia anoeciicola TaxID=2994492 RepID=UPI003464D505